MTSIEMAASEAAADALSRHAEEALALAQAAAYRAAVSAGANRLTAAAVSQRVVAEMTLP